MKHLKVTKMLLAISILGIMTACSSESTLIGNVKVSDVSTSDCKTSLSKADTRTEYYNDIYSKNPTLTMLMGNNYTINAQFIDVMDNCEIRQFHVDANSHDNTIVIILYPEQDMLTDCVCQYDVNFKMQNLLPGNYQIVVYHTTSTKQTNSSNKIYEGTVNLEMNKSVTLTMIR